MTGRLAREYGKACGIALLVVAVLGGVASVPILSAASITLAPGMLLAAIIFPPEEANPNTRSCTL